MANEGVNHGRRRFLTATTAVVGGAGALAAAVPFIKTWLPSAKAKSAGAPVQQDISKIEVGQMVITEWRGQPVWIVRRSPEQVGTLASLNARLRDPESKNEDQQPKYAQNLYRSIKEEWLVMIGVCTHLGCVPLGQKPTDPKGEFGGWFCPCHGSQYDTSGRIRKGPAPRNLEIPAYIFETDTTLLVGAEAKKS